MNTREMLELAAKAAGYRVDAELQAARDAFGHGHVGLWIEGNSCWNPINDDGDAMRLAVALSLNIFLAFDCPGINTALVTCYTGAVKESPNPCPYAATRLAIVRAAAAIGKSMK